MTLLNPLNDPLNDARVDEREASLEFAATGRPVASIPPTVSSLEGLSSPFLREQVIAFLRPLGLEGLTDWALGILGEGGFSPEKLEIELEEQPAFRERFPAIFERRAEGLPPVSVQDVLNYERQVNDLASFWGVPEGIIDAQAQMIANKSFNELQAVLSDAVQFLNGDPLAVQELTRQVGVTRGELIGWALDEKATLPTITTRLEGARLSAVAQRQGFGGLTAEESEILARRGIDANQAQQAFSVLASELGDVLPGEAGEGLSREDEIAFAAGEEPAIRTLERIRRQRQGIFEEGGGFAGGVAGIGTAE